MKTLVTGDADFIGRLVVRHILADTVVAVVSFDVRSYLDNLSRCLMVSD
jgi:dTDP-D-glucose 4,6-dehydratase